MWRPENWAKLLLKHTRKRLDDNSKVDKSIEWGMLNCAEAGADAMLEGLANLVGDDGYITFNTEDGEVVAVYIDD